MKTIKLDTTLKREDKLCLIRHFYESYYGTDQDIDIFAVEFYDVVGKILNDEIPVELDYLSEYEKEMLNILNNDNCKYILLKLMTGDYHN